MAVKDSKTCKHDGKKFTMVSRTSKGLVMETKCGDCYATLPKGA